MILPLLLAACQLAAPAPEAPAGDSVIVGQLLSNQPMSYAHEDCPEGAICLFGWWKSVVRVQRVLRGPRLRPRVSSANRQHTSRNWEYLHATSIFVLHPIPDATLRTRLRVDYLLEVVAYRRADGRYCFYDDPRKLGLTGKLQRDEHESYCLELSGRDP